MEGGNASVCQRTVFSCRKLDVDPFLRVLFKQGRNSLISGKTVIFCQKLLSAIQCPVSILVYKPTGKPVILVRLRHGNQAFFLYHTPGVAVGLSGCRAVIFQYGRLIDPGSAPLFLNIRRNSVSMGNGAIDA